MSKEHFTVEDGVDSLRQEKNQPNSLGSLFYALMRDADPAIVEKMEEQFGTVIAAGKNIGAEFARNEKDPAKKEAFKKKLFEIATKQAESLEE